MTILKDGVTREISVEVIEAMPALKEVECVDTYEDPAPFLALEPVCLASERYTALYLLAALRTATDISGIHEDGHDA